MATRNQASWRGHSQTEAVEVSLRTIFLYPSQKQNIKATARIDTVVVSGTQATQGTDDYCLTPLVLPSTHASLTTKGTHRDTEA